MTDSTPDSNSTATPHRLHSIGAVLEQLQPDFPDISVSKIRFLESRGLISPHRAPSGYRKFSAPDIDRLRWILAMQRDHFLPLRVIKERLDRGDLDLDLDHDADPGDDPIAAEAPTRDATTHFQPKAPESESLDPADLARLAGISAAELDDLVRFGLVESRDDGTGPRFDRVELRIARAAGAFLRRGIEARHLKAWRVAAEREAGLLEQVVAPMTRQNAADATARARDVADDLIDMGNAIREAIIVKTLGPSLGYDRD